MKIPKTTFLFIRHARTAWNEEQRHVGKSDIPLTEDANKRIILLTEILLTYPISVIYSSPLQRCLKTIEKTAMALGLPIIEKATLIERNLGEWEGKTAEELLQLHPTYHFPDSAFDKNFIIPGAETLSVVEKRVRTFLGEALQEHSGETIAVSTHSGIIWMLEHHIVANPPANPEWPGNCSIYTIDYDSKAFWLRHKTEGIK